MAVVTHAANTERGGEGRREIFPRLGMFVASGLLIGLMASGVTARLAGGGTPVQYAGAAGLGAIVGLFVGLGRGVWRPGAAPARDEAIERVEPSAHLWDPWLDDGRDLEIEREAPGKIEPANPEPNQNPELEPEPEPAAVAAETRAAVRPRVLSPRTGEAIRLDDELGARIEEGRGGLIVVVCPPGWGKRTAMRHLAAVLPPWSRGRIRMLGIRRPEDLSLAEFAAAGPEALVVIFASGPGARFNEATLATITTAPGIPANRVETYRLAPWDQDDAIEYLLATDRDACASVMARLKRSGDFSYLRGIPELVAVVLDRMARDESIANVREALHLELADRLGNDDGLRRRVETLCLAAVRQQAGGVSDARGKPLPGPLPRLVRHRPVALLVAADRIAAIIESGRADPALAGRHTRDLIREVAQRIAGNTRALDTLTGWMKPRHRGLHSLAASLLHAASPGWRPEPGRRPNLEDAYLPGARWSDVDLARADLRSVDLSRADLRWANLEKADARNAVLSGADLTRANLKHSSASDADLSRANLSQADASNAVLNRANLQEACLTRAWLWRAYLIGARIDGADFSGANLEDAHLTLLPLRLARLDGARFGGADLTGCDLEGMELPGVDLHDAKLHRADLTATRMPGANLLGADLRDARLAEVSWRGADLRDADLRGADFHLGSTRSGKLDSPIACEGSRTGFYTDDDIDLDLDRQVKPPEDVRKADLREVDLRGADIRDVDFYLVDLRGARYTPNQGAHLRRCRAILDGPV